MWREGGEEREREWRANAESKTQREGGIDGEKSKRDKERKRNRKKQVIQCKSLR